MFAKRLISALVLFAFVVDVQAMTTNELFDAINAQGNVSAPSVIRGQTMNIYSGGSMFIRVPKKTYQLAAMTPPKWSAGCGGIDPYLGSFSFINQAQFVAMLRQIGSNALGYGFKLAIQNLCPTCDNVMQALEATSRFINKSQIDSCEQAKGIVNAVAPETWRKDTVNTAKTFGVSNNAFTDVSQAWDKVFNDDTVARQTIKDASDADPAKKAIAPVGNVTWKALKKINVDDSYRMLLMSLAGTVILPSVDQSPIPRYILPTDITVQKLVGGDEVILDVPVLQCMDSLTEDGCLVVQEASLSPAPAPFRKMVLDKLMMISQKMSDRQAYDSVDDVKKFVNTTDLPVYKMVAVATSAGNTEMTNALLGRYADLIASKYADAYIEMAVHDVRQALAAFAAQSDASSSEYVKTKIEPNLAHLLAESKAVVAQATRQTMSAFTVAQELQQMERALSSNLSQSLRTSLVFGKSLKR